MKKFLIIFFSFVIVAALVGILLFFLVFNKPKEEIFDVGHYIDMSFELDKANYSASVKKGDDISPIGKLSVPQKVLFEKQEYTVVEVADNGFKDCEIAGIELPDSIKIIGDFAFSGCSQVDGEVKLPGSLVKIGQSAFKGCSMSGDLVLPAGLEFLGASAFENCVNLNGSLNIPRGVKEIQDYTFSGCVNINSRLMFHGDLLRIGQEAFKNCEKITELVFAEGLESIGSGAFHGCKGIKGEVALPNSLMVINADTFNGCQNIVEFKLPNALTTIDLRAFYGCSKLKEIKIGSTVTTIGSEAFDGCDDLTDVYIASQAVFDNLYSALACGCIANRAVRNNIYLKNTIDLTRMNTYFSINYTLRMSEAKEGYLCFHNVQNP